MGLSIGRGYRQQNSILRPANNGIAMVAKNRIQQAVAMQNARTVEALKVDGVDLQIWLKQFSGQLCTCSMHNHNNPYLPPISEEGVNDYTPFSEMLGDEEFQVEETYNEPVQSWNEMQDIKTDDITEDLIEKYAASQNNSLIFGGDKTPCGICYGTGYKEGYQLYNGKRIILDYFNEPDTFGFTLKRTYPYSYEADYRSDNYIIWKTKVPTYFKKYYGIRVRNNVEYCKDYTLYISFDGSNWTIYEDSLITGRNGKDTTIYLKIVPYDLYDRQSNKFSVTHIEMFYQLGDFVKGDFPPINREENWELFEALNTTELELAGDASYIDRECIIGEPKSGNIWKVISVTPHMTSDRQIFKYDLNLRMLQQSENAYLLNLINRPYIILNYRGLEQKQDMLTYSGEYDKEYK